MNVRFWTRINGSPVKITMKPGDKLIHYTSKPNDEGYSFEAHSWHYYGDVVFLEHTSGGSDCDGPISHYTDLWCRIDQLDSGNEFEGVIYPDWKLEASEVFDAYAQAANY